MLSFVLTERSQDSEVVLLSDSNSTQDAFTDPTSSQDSSHKPGSGKVGPLLSESPTTVKDAQHTSEDTGIEGFKGWNIFWFSLPARYIVFAQCN